MLLSLTLALAALAPFDCFALRDQLLAQSPPTEALFRSLVDDAPTEMAKRQLPGFTDNPENVYSEAHVAFRKELYGPLREKAETRELLRAIARKAAANGFDWNAMTAAIFLADAPDAGDMAALLDGYLAAAADDRASLARQLGRALAAKPAGAEAELAKALAQLRDDAANGKAAARGAAIEGLFRAGEIGDVTRLLKPLLDDGADPLAALPVLSGCSRLFQRADIDPFLKARAIAAARATIERMLDGDGAGAAAATRVISGEGRALRSAISFLNGLGGDDELRLLVRCLVDQKGPKLLGMDGIQNLRYALEAKRAKAPPELVAQLDDHWLSLIVAPATRLFALAEEPMDQDERRAFAESRDLRYNALAWFCAAFQRQASLRDRLRREGDLPALLATLASAKRDVEADDRFTEVQEKVENRILALQLLALMQREWNVDPGGLDLFAEAYAILCGEILAPLLPIPEVVAFREARAAGRVLELRVGRQPADPWVKNTACQTIADLGYVLNTSPTAIQIEADAKNPWPWLAKKEPEAKADGQ